MNEQITVNLNNFTEEEREQFKTLLEKGNTALIAVRNCSGMNK